MNAIVLFGIGSPLAVEYEETCRRLGITIVAAVQNHPGATFAGPIVALAELDSGHLAVPCIVPLFTPGNRAFAAAEAATVGFSFAEALIDPTAIVASTATAGHGSYVNAGCIVGARSVLGAHAVVNRGASIGHHAAIGAFVSIGPGAIVAGNVAIGSGTMIGAGAVLLPSVSVGAGATVCAGSVVVDDVAPGTVVVGNPARVAAPARRHT